MDSLLSLKEFHNSLNKESSFEDDLFFRLYKSSGLMMPAALTGAALTGAGTAYGVSKGIKKLKDIPVNKFQNKGTVY